MMEDDFDSPEVSERRMLLQNLGDKLADRTAFLEQEADIAQADAFPRLPALLDKAALTFMGEQANGGICSIAVNNILTDLAEVPPQDWNEAVVEIYDRTAQDFAEVTEKRVARRSLLGNYRYREVPAIEEFTRVGAPIKLDSGLTVLVGFCRDEFGVWTRDGSFVPMIEFTDRRDIENQCSYAQFTHTNLPFGENMVVTKADETIVVAVSEERGLVVTKAVLDEINRLQVATRDGKAGIDMSAIAAYLDIDTVISNILALDPQRNYDSEEQLRLKVLGLVTTARLKGPRGSKAFHEPIVIESGEFDGIMGAATDCVVNTYVAGGAPSDESASASRAGEALSAPATNVIVQTIEFPNANITRPETVWRLDMGRRIGRAALIESGLTESSTTDVIDYLVPRIPTQPVSQSRLAVAEPTQPKMPELGDQILNQLFERSWRQAKALADRLEPSVNLEFSDKQQRKLIEKWKQLVVPDGLSEVYMVPNLSFDEWKTLLFGLVDKGKQTQLRVSDMLYPMIDSFRPSRKVNKNHVQDTNGLDWFIYRVAPDTLVDCSNGAHRSLTMGTFLTMLVDRLLNNKPVDNIADRGHKIRADTRLKYVAEVVYDPRGHRVSIRR